MKEHIRRHVHLSEIFHQLVQSRSDLFSVLAGPAFALVVLTIKPRPTAQDKDKTDSLVNGDKKSHSEANAITKKVFEKINSQGEIHLTNTVVDDEYAIRVVSANPKAQEKYIRRAFEILVNTTEEILSQ